MIRLTRCRSPMKTLPCAELPISRAEGTSSPDLMVAFFTAVSAVCVTGLTIVDTGTYWSTFGHVALLVMFQIGGLGMMVSATLLGLWAARSLRLRMRMLLQSETRALSMGDVSGVLRVVLITTLVIESTAALLLALRFAGAYDRDWNEAVWLGLFHAVSAFNNAGFSVFAVGKKTTLPARHRKMYGVRNEQQHDVCHRGYQRSVL